MSAPSREFISKLFLSSCCPKLSNAVRLRDCLFNSIYVNSLAGGHFNFLVRISVPYVSPVIGDPIVLPISQARLSDTRLWSVDRPPKILRRLFRGNTPASLYST